MSSRSPISFRIYKGDILIRERVLIKSVIKIGKLESSDLHIEDDSASQMHAVIEVPEPFKARIIDIGSSSGTFVNGAQITRANLSTGDTIKIGETQIVISYRREQGSKMLKIDLTIENPYDLFEWETSTVTIKKADGSIVFEQEVEFPSTWSQTARGIVAEKYFKIKNGKREWSLRQLVGRVVTTITNWGIEGGYFDMKSGANFEAHLTYMILDQRFAFNSPVWFNVGLRDKPQTSACFIQSVEDSMESILDLAKSEGMLFKHGSGTGSNLSRIREEGAPLTGGGTATGPVSFMRGFDSFAGAIKSGGRCLVGSQYVYTKDGPVQAKDLEGKEFILISYDPPSNRFIAKAAECWRSGHKRCLRIETTDGTFELSADHPVRLGSGNALEVDRLETGMALMKCTIDADQGHMGVRTHDQYELAKYGYTDYRDEITTQVLSIEEIGRNEVYSIEVRCPTPDDKSATSGHTFVIWPDARPAGSGIVVFNTRRAAKMAILDIDHPDIEKFIKCKANEEQKAWALIDAGYDGGFNIPGGAYDSVSYQNANHSVRVTDEFMQAVMGDGEWYTSSRVDGSVVKLYRAKDLLRRIAKAAHLCGDPGIQFDTTINKWNPCRKSGWVGGSNPCSEFMFLDDSACNLGSHNLKKYIDLDSYFDYEEYRADIRIAIIAMEILVSNSSYPTEKIEKNSHRFRPLGLGYANLGALLMSLGIPYDSVQGRDWTAEVTSFMGAVAYTTSAEIAGVKGPCEGYEENKETFLDVIRGHGQHDQPIDLEWQNCLELGRKNGFRNSQATVLAPTGTIGLMMDCDTTGIEPDTALVKYKRLVGGGMLKIVNQSVTHSLEVLGYTTAQIEKIVEYIDEKETIEGAPGLKPEHLPVFDCAFRSANGTRSIHYMGHVRMMAAAQPFLSGAISKTVCLPNDATIEDFEDAYIQAWKLGLKSIAAYRDGSKRSQPLSTSKETEQANKVIPRRKRLPATRDAKTHKFSVANHQGYITLGLFPDGSPGELFVRMAKEGSTLSGLIDGFATAISLALQYGVPVEVLINKFKGTRFEPSGFTGDTEIKIATSILDYIFRWLEGNVRRETPQKLPVEPDSSDSPLCSECGYLMSRNGPCFLCSNCGNQSGACS